MQILNDLKLGFHQIEDEFKRGKFPTIKSIVKRLEEMRDGVLVKEAKGRKEVAGDE